MFSIEEKGLEMIKKRWMENDGVRMKILLQRLHDSLHLDGEYHVLPHVQVEKGVHQMYFPAT